MKEENTHLLETLQKLWKNYNFQFAGTKINADPNCIPNYTYLCFYYFHLLLFFLLSAPESKTRTPALSFKALNGQMEPKIWVKEICNFYFSTFLNHACFAIFTSNHEYNYQQNLKNNIPVKAMD